jgi:hypothetical protein
MEKEMRVKRTFTNLSVVSGLLVILAMALPLREHEIWWIRIFDVLASVITTAKQKNMPFTEKGEAAMGQRIQR